LDDLSVKVNQLYNTLDNLLSWSAVQIKGNEVTQNILYMSNSIDETLALLEYSISSKNINIIQQICSSSQISFNEHRLQVLLRNIIGNAIKFTPQEGFIRIYDKEDNNYYHLLIQDSGIGIPKTLLENWQTIYHKSRLGTMGEKGTGLGLKLCRDLLVASNGDMLIRSNEKGTTVELLFAK
jgi:signal transduction histidine kinase